MNSHVIFDASRATLRPGTDPDAFVVFHNGAEVEGAFFYEEKDAARYVDWLSRQTGSARTCFEVISEADLCTRCEAKRNDPGSEDGHCTGCWHALGENQYEDC